MNFFLTSLLLAGCLVYSGYACFCAFPSQKEAWDRADIVVKMNVVSKEKNGTWLVYKANYLTIYKPQNQSHILIPVPILTPQETAACGATGLKVGKDYLIAATYNENNQMQINSCSGMPADGQNVSKPPGALLWKYVTPSLQKKLETGVF